MFTEDEWLGRLEMLPADVKVSHIYLGPRGATVIVKGIRVTCTRCRAVVGSRAWKDNSIEIHACGSHARVVKGGER